MAKTWVIVIVLHISMLKLAHERLLVEGRAGSRSMLLIKIYWTFWSSWGLLGSLGSTGVFWVFWFFGSLGLGLGLLGFLGPWVYGHCRVYGVPMESYGRSPTIFVSSGLLALWVFGVFGSLSRLSLLDVFVFGIVGLFGL